MRWSRGPLVGAAALVVLAAAARAASWPDQAAGLAPGLLACLAGDGTAMVEDAWEIAQDKIGMRIWRAGTAEYCVAELAGRVLLRDPLPAAPPPDPAAPAFFLQQRCADARRVEAPDGRILGWLAYPACG